MKRRQKAEWNGRKKRKKGAKEAEKFKKEKKRLQMDFFFLPAIKPLQSLQG